MRKTLKRRATVAGVVGAGATLALSLAAAPATAAAPAFAPYCAPTAAPITAASQDAPQSWTETTPAGGISSTITVGEAGRIADVDVTTLLDTQISGQATITLTHTPANGGSPVSVVLASPRTDGGVRTWDYQHHLWDGTTWDDQAEVGVISRMWQPEPPNPEDRHHPLGEIAPEGRLAAFNGRDAQGAWTLTVTDTKATTGIDDAGTLTKWSLAIARDARVPAVTVYSPGNTGAVAIPDATVTGPDVVPGAEQVIPLTVTAAPGEVVNNVSLATTFTKVEGFGLDQPFLQASSDLQMTLVAPDGTRVAITSGRDDMSSDMAKGVAEWTDTAAGTPLTRGGDGDNPLQPMQTFARFTGVAATGQWTLRVRDTNPGDTFQFESASLTVHATVGCLAPPTPVTPGDGTPVTPGGGTPVTPSGGPPTPVTTTPVRSGPITTTPAKAKLRLVSTVRGKAFTVRTSRVLRVKVKVNAASVMTLRLMKGKRVAVRTRVKVRKGWNTVSLRTTKRVVPGRYVLRITGTSAATLPSKAVSRRVTVRR